MAVLISDSFNRADSTTTLGTTDSYNGGTNTAWTVSSGAWGISGNRAYYVNVTGTSIAYLNTGILDHTVSCILNGAITGNYRQPLIVFRMLNTTNYLYVRLEGFQMSLRKVDGGVTTQLATYSKAYADSTDYSIKVVCSGNSITIYDGATPVISYTLSGDNVKYSESAYTNAGISQVSFSTNAIVTKFDNFQVEGADGGTDATITAVPADSTADSIAPSITTASNVSVSSVIADAIADALAPSVGSSTNVTVNAVVVDVTATANVPIVDAVRNIGIDSVTANALADALTPFVGSSVSAQISAIVAEVTADSISPSVSVGQSSTIQSVIASVNVNGIAPTIRTDALISAFTAELHAMANAPSLNAKVIIGVIELNGKRELYVYLVGKSTTNVSLKGGL